MALGEFIHFHDHFCFFCEDYMLHVFLILKCANSSHPRYRAALYKRFPSLACGGHGDDTVSTTSGVTQVSGGPLEEKEETTA